MVMFIRGSYRQVGRAEHVLAVEFIVGPKERKIGNYFAA
jgi:hypothetical protein